MSARHHTIAITTPTFERLTQLARARGISKAKLVESLLEGVVPIPAVADRDEALRLLSESARTGKVQAQVALVRALAASEPAPSEIDPLDELADRRRGQA